jgi:L-lactate dehydrogenase complex protein LldE
VSTALFVPCFVDQFFPKVAIAALDVLERLGLSVDVPGGASCCGQPPANAGFERFGDAALAQFVRTYAPYDTTIILSGSCATHVLSHASSFGADGARVAARGIEFCRFLHDVVGVERVAALRAECAARVAVHIGCHALRGLGLASPSETHVAPFDKVRTLLETVKGMTFAEPARRDECCGFGGSFSVTEPEVSARMGRDRLRDYRRSGADIIVSTDVSCVMHLRGLADRDGRPMPMLHVAEVLAGPVAVA